jgi:hypothetical protein
MSGHGFDASLLRPHILVEQVVGLQVQHAGPLLHVYGVGRFGALSKVVADTFGDIFPIENLVGRHRLPGQMWNAFSGHHQRHVRRQSLELLIAEF